MEKPASKGAEDLRNEKVQHSTDNNFKKMCQLIKMPKNSLKFSARHEKLVWKHELGLERSFKSSFTLPEEPGKEINKLKAVDRRKINS